MGGGGFIGAVVSVVGVFTGNPWLIAIGRTLLVSAVLGAIGGALQKKPSQSGATMSAQGRLETVRQPLGPRQVIFGRVRVGGTLTFFETTTDNQTALMIVTLSGHPVARIRDVYFNDLSSLDYGVAGAGGSAGGRFAGYATVYRSNGDEGASQPFSDLVATSASWTNDHLQRDCSKVYTKHVFSNEVWQTGLPSINAVIDGVCDIYDPRQGSPTWTGWTNNPALVIANYITASFGLGADYATEIDEDALIAAANVCDERVTLSGNRASDIASVDTSNDWLTMAVDSPHVDYGDGVRFSAGSPGSMPGGLTEGVTYYAIPVFEGDTTVGQIFRVATSHANAIAGLYVDITGAGSGGLVATLYDEPRYRLNGAFDLSEKPQAILERMLMSMAGKLVNTGGVWYIYAGAYAAPTLTFDEDDFAGPLELQTNVSRSENANSIKGTFVDPSQRYQPVDFPAVTSDTYLNEDGGERVWRDLNLTSFVTSGTQAQRLAKIDLISTRLGLTVRARFKLGAFRMLTGTTVALTNEQLGWDAKAFEVVNCTLVLERDGRMEVDALMRETDAARYDWSVSDEQLASIAPNTNLPDPTAVAAPTALTAAQSTTVWDTVELSCTAPNDVFVQSYQFEYRLIQPGSPQTGEWTVMPRVDDPYIEITRLLARSYQFRALSVNRFGATSDYGDIVELTMLPPMGNSSGSLSGSGALRKVGTLSTENYPFGMGWSPELHEIYICCDGTIAIHNDITGAYIESVDNGLGSPQQSLTSMVYCPSNGYFYCGAESDALIVVFDPATRSIVTNISTTTIPAKSGAYCDSNDSIYFSCRNELAVIDCATNTKTTDISSVDASLFGSACFCPANGMIYAGDNNSGNLDVIDPDTNTVLTSIALSSAISGFQSIGLLAWCPVDEKIYGAVRANSTEGKMAVIDPYTNTLVDTILLDGGVSPNLLVVPKWATYCPESRLIYVADDARNAVITVSPLSRLPTQEISFGTEVVSLLWVPSSSVLLVANNTAPGVVTRLSF